MKTKILNLNEDYYTNGKLSGEYFKKIIQKNILHNEKESSKRVAYLSDKVKKLYPHYYEELKGKADGANVDFNTYFSIMCPELLEIESHCTTIMCKKANTNFILSHNEDDSYETGNFCISKVTI